MEEDLIRRPRSTQALYERLAALRQAMGWLPKEDGKTPQDADPMTGILESTCHGRR
ncbi:MAG: hypothetical protein FD149_2203 [Rhodospirillaceae bacterium]|nr:MAG: hypothetical protein FD149_2203 [Rhodospirillaceae bacterium]